MGSSGLRKQLLCQILDETADRKPDQLFCIHPISPDISQGWRRVTMADLAGAVNYTAWWIERTIGQGNSSEPLAYMGARDLRYATFAFACMKTGHSVLFPSPRNSETAFLHVLNATKSFKFFFSAEQRKVAEELQQVNKNLQSWEVPGLWEMFDKKVDCYPCVKQYADVEDEAPIIIHSSGTTGFPKPVYLTNGFWSVMDNNSELPIPEGRKGSLVSNVKPGGLFFIMAPFFHLMGLVCFIESICHNTPFVLSPEKPMTIELLARIIDETRPVTSMLTPSVIEDIGSSLKGLDLLRRFEVIFFGGAPLSPKIGDTLCQDVFLQTVIGSSEAGFIPSLALADMNDWEWFEWNPFAPIDMQYAVDGAYELVLRRTVARDYNAIFHTYPEPKEYRTKDLFVPHPTKAGLWRYQGRFDDVIVLSNGEKFNPIEMEQVIEGHPLVSKALIVGQGRFQSALLIEPNWHKWAETQAEDLLVDKIWSSVQEANIIAPAHGRVLRTKIGIASKDKPFKKTPKGSTQRRLVINDYTEEIDAIYDRPDEEYIDQVPLDATIENITNYVQQVVSRLLSVEQVPEKSDIFTMGLDSLQTLQLSKILQGGVRFLRPEDALLSIPTQKLYSYPSVEQLSNYVYGLVNDGSAVTGLDAEEDSARSERIAALIEKYTKDLPENQVSKFNRNRKHVIILTGSTGSLGNYILSELIFDPTVSKIYCLNRSEDAEARQVRSFKEKGFTIPSDFSSRVEFLQARFGAEKLGVSSSKYKELTESVDTIIHNAWKVNFNHKVEAFEDTHIKGVRRLVEFSLESTHSAHIHFISSVSTVGGWTTKHGPSVPEFPLEDPDVALRQGYGESKFISERICAIASVRSGVPTSFYRVGQIAGATTEKGVWNKQEWLPSIVATSKVLKKIPKDLGFMPVDWIPVDSLARIIVDVTRSRRETDIISRNAAYNLVNPSLSSWSLLIPSIRARYAVEPVDFGQWLATLEAFTNPTETDFQDKPALKILDFYRGLHGGHGEGLGAPLQTAQTQAASETMRTLSPVNATLMENWLKQWSF